MESKKPWESSGIIGGVVAIISAGMMLTGVTVDPATQSFLTSTITMVASGVGAVVGGVLAIYGRWTAEKKIGL